MKHYKIFLSLAVVGSLAWLNLPISTTTSNPQQSLPSYQDQVAIPQTGMQRSLYQPIAAPNGTYVNSDGDSVARPYFSNSVPAGASAQCGDGSYSFSQHRQGTCSHHGGVSTWF
jgi:hypothetical protein